PRQRDAIGSGTQNRTGEELAQIGSTSVNVAANQIRVLLFNLLAIHRMAEENAFAKAGSEAFDLLFDALGHIERGTVGNVAVSPSRMLAFWSAGWIEKTRLREQHKGPFRRFALGDFAF